MHLRRAVLLFAVVLGLAAVAAALSRPARKSREQPVSPGLPSLAPEPAASGPTQLRFSQDTKRRTRSLTAGSSAIVTVNVRRPGQVELEGFGLTANAEPLTPARFDVLADNPGRHDVLFTPASGKPKVVGVLRVTQASR